MTKNTYWLQWNVKSYVHLNARIRLKSLRILPVNTVHAGHNQSKEGGGGGDGGGGVRGDCPQMSANTSGTSWNQCRSMVQYSFTSTETRQPRTVTSTLTQLLNYVTYSRFASCPLKRQANRSSKASKDPTQILRTTVLPIPVRACSVYQTPGTGLRHPSFNHCSI